VATKMANPDRIIYFDIEDQHPDTYRFLKDCEKWFEKKIEIYKSPYRSVDTVCRAVRYLNGPAGAACSLRLKKWMRKEWEQKNPGCHTYIWGFDGTEKNRMERIKESITMHNHLFPLHDRTKGEGHGILRHAGILRPAMYRIGFRNNNCIGCLRGGMGYWNRIRSHFPAVFAFRSHLERDIGAHILKECYLDELDPKRGRFEDEIFPDCGLFCEIEEGAQE